MIIGTTMIVDGKFREEYTFYIRNHGAVRSLDWRVSYGWAFGSEGALIWQRRMKTYKKLIE